MPTVIVRPVIVVDVSVPVWPDPSPASVTVSESRAGAAVDGRAWPAMPLRSCVEPVDRHRLVPLPVLSVVAGSVDWIVKVSLPEPSVMCSCSRFE